MEAPSHLKLVSAVVLLVLLHPVSAAERTVIPEIEAGRGVVAADDERCSKIGRDVLVEGGNAVDAAVATTLCLGVVQAGSSGIGGGAFMLVRLANGTAKAFDMRDAAPSMATENMYDDNPDAKSKGPLSVAIPGEVAGLHEAWKQYGSRRINWERLVRPAVLLAKNGYQISKYLYTQMLIEQSSILADPGLRSVYSAGGKLLQPGDITKNVKLADTLEAIAQQGPSVLYNGSIGLQLVSDIQKGGGIISTNDLASYRVVEREPLSADVFGPRSGLKVLTMPPPSGGGASLILMLNILERFGIPSGVSGNLGRQRFVEALKHVFAVRMNIGDWDFKPTVHEVIDDMLDPMFAKAIRLNITDDKTFDDPRLYGATWAPIPDDGTSHLSIIDEERNAVALTTSVNWHFGSLFLSPSTGILLNNQMDDFSTPNSSIPQAPAPANYIQPLKRPLSSMTPTIVLKDGQLKAVIGASGGPLIIIATTQVFLNHFGMRMEPYASVVSPRCYHKLFPNVVYYENYTTVTGVYIQVPDDTVQYLQGIGHELESWTGEGAICQFVVHNLEGKGDLTGVSDPRKGGFPAGY